MTDLSGLNVGQYRLIRKLGTGGMAEVYQAYQPRLDRYVALKFIRPELSLEENFKARFEREAKAIARLSHGNIIHVHDFGVQDNKYYLVMEYVDGYTLKEYMKLKGEKGEGIPFDEILFTMEQVGSALDYAHQNNIVHRDLKPDNILISKEGRAVLGDFGIAKILDEGKGLTQTGAAVGTPAYMSPEQIEGNKEKIGPASDIYSLGIILYELVIGQPPFTADTPIAVMLKHISDPIPTPRSVNPDIPERVERVILKSLAKEPDDRFQKANEFVLALKQGTTIEEALPRPVEPALGEGAKEGRTKRSPILQWAVAAIFGLVLIVLLSVWYLGNKGGLPTVFTSLTPQMESTEGLLVVVNDPTAAPTVMPEQIITALPSPTQNPTATSFVSPAPQAGDEKVNSRDNATLVFIPEGTFTMGLTAPELEKLRAICETCEVSLFLHSMPAHEVYVDSFWIYKTEVTNEMYSKCARPGNCAALGSLSSETRNDYYGNPAYGNFPVVNVYWFSASQYCSWAGGRLPTEAEWEKAARGADGRLFPWGDMLPNQALANLENRIGDTVEVGSYPQGASPYGVLDMSGNVWEWVSDWYEPDYYKNSPDSNPQGPGQSSQRRRSGRGGSWFWESGYASVAYHDWWEPEQFGTGVGFRCVVDVSPD